MTLRTGSKGFSARLGLVLVALSLTAACDKKDPPAADAGAAPTATATTAVTSDAGAAAGEAGAGAASAEAGASPSAAAATATGTASAFKGKYTVKPAAMYVPSEKDWANVKWKNDEAKHVGDGDMTLDIDAAGRVAGQTDPAGAMGAAVIEGSATATELTAMLRRKDPSDQGLMGTVTAKITGDKIEGVMKLSDANAASVREATFSLSKK